MANKKISDLTAATSIGSTDLFEIETAGGNSRKVAASLIGGSGSTPSARYWRLRLFRSVVAHSTDGLGLCLVDWQTSGGTSLIGSGNGVASGTDTAGGWTIAKAYNGSGAAGNGWFAGSSSICSAVNTWLGYDFGSAVTPGKVLFAPLNGFVWSIGEEIAVDYSSDGTTWRHWQMSKCATGVSNTQQTITLL